MDLTAGKGYNALVVTRAGRKNQSARVVRARAFAGAVIPFSNEFRWFFLRAAGGFAGFAVPSVVASKTAMAIVFALAGSYAVLGLLPVLRRPATWAGLKRPFALTVYVMLACWLVSALSGLAAGRSLAAWGWTTAIIAVGWVIGRALREDERAVTEALRSLVITSLLCMMLALAATYLWHGAIDPVGIRGVKEFHGARQKLKSYGSIAPVLAPLVVWAGWRLSKTGSGVWRIAGLAYLPLAGLLVFTVSSRAGLLGVGMLGLALVLALVLIRLPRRAAQWSAGAFFALAVAATVIFASYLPKPPISGLQDYRISKTFQVHRQAIWGFAVHHAMRAPVLGHGPDASRLLPGAKQRAGWFAHEYVPSHTHNWILQALVETGFLGLGAMLVVVAMLFGTFVRATARGNVGGWVGVALMGAFFGSWLANFSLWAAWWQASIVMLIAILSAAIAGGAPPITNTGWRAPLKGIARARSDGP